MTAKTRLAIALLAVAVHGVLAIERAAADPLLPPDAVASVRGTILTRDDLMREAVRRRGRNPSSQTVLQRIIFRLAIETEATARGVTVPGAEIDAFIAKLEKNAGGVEAFDRALEAEGRTRTDFRAFVRLSLLGQKLAANDLKVSGTPDNAQFQIWLTSLVEKIGTETDPAELPEGVVARVGEHEVGVIEYGEAIAKEIGDGILGEQVLEPWIAVTAIDQVLAKHGVTVTDEEVEADIERRRQEFEESDQAKALGIKYEQMLSAQDGRTLDDIRADHEFRSALAFRKHLAAEVTGEDVESWYRENSGAFGERRRIQQILVAAGRSDRFGSGGRTVEEGRRAAADIVARLNGGEAWDSVATASDTKQREPFTVTRNADAPKELLDAVFAAKPGDVIGPVKSLHGFHVMRVVAVFPPRTLEEVVDQVRRAVIKERERQFTRALREDPAVIRAARFR